jgi:hypothetical protein
MDEGQLLLIICGFLFGIVAVYAIFSKNIKFKWRSKSWLNNLWTSAFYTMGVLTVITFLIEVIWEFEAAEKVILKYDLQILGITYIIVILTRIPHNQRSNQST